MPLLNRFSSNKTSKKNAQITDVNARNTTVLLTGESATNTWLSDESQSNLGKSSFTVTGVSRASNQNPYLPLGSYSTYFNGSSSLTLTAPSIGPAFTVDMWLYIPSSPNNVYMYSGSSATGGPLIQINSNKGWGFGQQGSISVNGPNGGVPIGRWVHVAFVRTDTGSSGSKIYQDGVLVATGQITTSTYTSGLAAIGASDANTQFFTGYISNFRIINSAIYTGNFNPPPINDYSLSSTLLLACGSSRFIDKGTANATLTLVGNPTITQFTPYQNISPITSYNTYGSAFIDGTNYVTISAPVWSTLSQVFTVEAWFYFSTAPALNAAVMGVLANSGFMIYSQSSTGNWVVNKYGVGDIVATSTPITIGKWTHVAVTRNSSNLMTIWIDGVSAGTATIQYNFTLGDWQIGNQGAGAITGYVSDFRVVLDTAVYTSAFTPPTAPLAPIAGTAISTFRYNSPTSNNEFRDGSIVNQRIERTGIPSQGALNPFGDNWSYYFGGYDWIQYPHIEQYNIFGFDAMIEFWINPAQADSSFRGIINHATTAANWQGWQIYYVNGKIYIETNDGAANPSGVRYSATIETPVGVWSFIRIVKTSYELWSIYQNGVNIGTIQDIKLTNNVSTPLIIGQSRNTGPNFIGHITNLRIVKGYSVNVDTPFNTPVAYFTGSSYVSNATSTALTFGTDPYTVELWMNSRKDSIGEYDVIESNPISGSWQIYMSSGLKYGTYGVAGTNILDAANATAILGNTWNHIAVSRATGGITNTYVNGRLTFTGTDNFNYTGVGVTIGGRNTGTNYFTGGITNVRAIKGTALYTSDFEPQRRPLGVTQTSLDTRIYPDKSNSVYFNGTTDYLTIPNSSAHGTLGSNDFTVELWFNTLNITSSATGTQYLISHRNADYVPFLFWIETGGALKLYASSSNAGWNLVNGGTMATIAAGTWYHLAYSRNGSNHRIFLNGIQVYTYVFSGSFTATSNTLNIGGSPGDTNALFYGYISNARLINGTGLYTNNFAPPNAAFLSVPNTSVLTCQSSTFIDNSPNKFTISTFGNPRITNKFPYTFGDVVPSLSANTSLLTLRNTTIVDNSTANIIFTTSGIPNISRTLDIPAVPDYSFLPLDPKIPFANVSLLTAKTNRVGIDQSYYNNQATLTNSSNILVTKFNPLQPSVSVPITYAYIADKFNCIKFQGNDIMNSFTQSTGLPMTWELWIMQTSNVGADSYIFGGGANDFSIKIDPTNNLNLVNPGFTNFATIDSTTAPNSLWVNNWCHIAVTCSGGVGSTGQQWNVFINGSNVWGTRYARDWSNDGVNVLSNQTGAGTAAFGGYVSNFRMTRGKLYEPTVKFNPLNEPLQLTGETVALTAQDPILIGKSDSYNLIAPLIIQGPVKTPSTFNPYGWKQTPIPSLYDANAFGGSTYFNGNGQYLTVNEFQSQRLANSFTIQGWFNATSKVAGNIVIASKGAVNTGWEIGIGRANTLIFSNATTAIATTTPIRFNEWNHFAVTRDDNTNYTRLFLNGNLEVTGTITNPYTETANIKIGSGRVAGANVFTGYISGLQIDKGVAYANSFVVPFFAQRPTANTVFYLESKPSVIDYSGKTNFETISSNYMSKPFTDPWAFGLNNSVYFRASNPDYYTVADNAQHRLESGDFTVEGYMYPVSVGGAQRQLFGKGTNTTGLEMRIGGAVSGGLDFSLSSTAVTNSWVVTQNTWHHFALTRGANVMRAFLDGILVSSYTSNTIFNQTNNLNIGDGRVPGASFDGYISNFRIVKGTALYTANFSLPPTPLTAITNTTFLALNGYAGNIDSSSVASVLTIGSGFPNVQHTNPNVAVAYSSFTPVTTSMFFDGTGYVRSATAPNVSHLIVANTAPFTFEANVYPLADNATLNLMALGPEAPFRYVVYLNNGYLTTNQYGLGAANVGFPKVQPNTWTHIQVAREANIIYHYINGVRSTVTDTLPVNIIGGGQMIVGADASGNGQFKGWMKDVRLTIGASKGGFNANTFIPNRIIPAVPNPYTNIQPPLTLKSNVDYVIVAGGGGGGFNAGSGAGAGGFLQGTFAYIPGVTYPFTIGGGGTGSAGGDTVNGTNGSNTTIFGLVAYGGGAGGSATNFGNVGGSGGGCPSERNATTAGWYPGGDINNSWRRGQGWPGGSGAPGSGSGATRTTGGGGGAAAAGTPGAPNAGPGGNGAPTWITGSNVILAGGGGGGHHSALGGLGGQGGGGAAGNGPGNPGNAGNAGVQGTVNTGGGGGAGSGYNGVGASGGSGTILLRHPTAYRVASTTGNVLITTTSSNVVYQIYGSGTILFP